jgi:putative hydrolase of the HAD superfamily
MPDCSSEIFRRHFRPLLPIATGETPVLRKLAGIRCVLFDLYGTLFISASGEVGSAEQPGAGPACAPQDALAASLAALGIAASASVGRGAEYLLRAIEASHAQSRQAGIYFPEVDIVAIWQGVLARLVEEGLIEQPPGQPIDPKRLAAEYEARVNPCWPMPNVQSCLAELRGRGLLLGIVSNAQFYSRGLFEALLGQPAESWGFDPQLQYYSYEHGQAKPGLALDRLAAEALAHRGIAPAEVLYVGNDMLNDVLPAAKLGFRTALFAGDARSFQRRHADEQLEEISPELVLTDLAELPKCIIG